MTPAQRSALATIMGNRVAANAGLPPRGNPFADQITGHAPAKDKYVPDLTDRSAVARGRLERTKQHGLLTPAQRSAEARATLPAATAPTFHSRHDLTKTPLGDVTPPPVPHMSLQQIADMLGMGPRGASGALAPPGPPNRLAPPPPPADLLSPARNGREQLQRDQPHQGGFLPALGEWLQGPAVGSGNAAWLGRNVLAPAAKYAGSGLATGGRDLFEGLTGIGGPSAIDQILHQGALQKHIKEGFTTPAALNQRISNSEYNGPDPSKILVPLHDLSGVVTDATSAGISKAADGRTASLSLADLAGSTGWGLKPEARTRGIALIKRRGWTDAQIEAMGGDPTTFIKMQYSDPPSKAESIVKGIGQDIVTGGSQTVGALGLLSEAAQGRGPEAARSLLDQLHQTIPVFGKHPYSQELVAHPLFAATAGLALAKGAGAVGHALPFAPRERIAALKGQTDHVTGQPATLDLGHYNKNLFVGAQEKLHDVALGHSALAARYSWKHVGDLLVQQQRARITPEHIPVQLAMRNALRAVGPERAQELMALHDYGGAPGIADARAHFQARQNAGVEVPQSRIALLNHLEEVQRSLTPADEAFLKAHGAIAEHTSTAMQNRGAHSALTQLYRKYETVIEMGASREARAGTPGVFTEAKRARDEYLHMHESGGHPSDAWVARQKELLRNIAGHEKRASTPSARAVKAFQVADKAYREKLKPFRAKQQEIKAREPEKPVKGEKTTEQIVTAHKAWREELKAHNATRPVRPEPPAGLSRNAGRLSVHEGEVTREGKRAAGFQARLPEKTPDEQIMQDYHDAVQAAVTAHHAREGALEPARVERTNLPLDRTHKFPGRGRNLTSNLNVGHDRASTGESVRSGHYLYDPSSPLRENVHEQMNRMKSGLYNAVVNHPLVHDATGGGDRNARRVALDGGTDAEVEAARAPVTVPEGTVAVPVHYPGSSAQVTVPNWGSESPTLRSEVIDPNAKLSAIERLAQRRRNDGHLIAGEKIKDGERVLLIPEGLYQRLDEYAHPNGGAEPNWYDKVNRYYQKLLIGIYPSTWFGNGPGSIPLAMASGALHPRDYYRAFKSGPQGPVTRRLGIERTDTRNAALQNLGPGGGLGRLPRPGERVNPITRGIEGGRAASIAGENFSAAASWEGRARVGVDGRLPTLRKIIPGLDKIMPEHLKGAAAQMSVDAATLHRWLAENKITVRDDVTLPDEIQAMVDRGETKLIPGSLEGERSYALPPELQHLADRMTTGVIDFMSAGSRPRSSFGRVVGRAILFQSWIGHIVKLTLFTLPLKHPRRAALLNAVSMYGQEYRREHGVYPDWMTQFFPIGQVGNYERSVGVGQLTPTASALNLAQAGTNVLSPENPNNSYLDQINQVVSPLLQPFGSALLANYHNQGLKPSEVATQFRSPLHAFTAGAYFAIPGAHKFQPLSGYGPGSAGFMGIPIPGTAGLTKKPYFVYIDNGDGTHEKLPIRWQDRPGAHPETGPLGVASRYFGLPLERSPLSGAPLHTSITNDTTFARNADFNRRHPNG